MARTLSFLLVAGFLAATGCKTITEELPTTATAPPAVPQVNVPVPILVTPVQLPQPQSPAPAPNPNTPSPNSPPVPEGEGDGDGPDIPDNRNPVARVQAKVFFVECGGGVSGTGSPNEAPVGCRVHLDATPKDAGGKPTQAKGRPQWSYSDTSAIDIAGNSPFNPVLTVKKTGSTTASCTIDGIRSNDVSIRFVP